jgi:hypothetical protein
MPFHGINPFTYWCVDTNFHFFFFPQILFWGAELGVRLGFELFNSVAKQAHYCLGFLFCFVFVVLWFELGALHLLGRCSTT